MTLLARRNSPAGREVKLQGSTHLFRLSNTLDTYHSSPNRDTDGESQYTEQLNILG